MNACVLPIHIPRTFRIIRPVNPARSRSLDILVGHLISNIAELILDIKFILVGHLILNIRFFKRLNAGFLDGLNDSSSCFGRSVHKKIIIIFMKFLILLYPLPSGNHNFWLRSVASSSSSCLSCLLFNWLEEAWRKIDDRSHFFVLIVKFLMKINKNRM